MQAKAAQVSALFGGRMPMTMTSPPGGVTHVPTVDDLKNYLFRVKELQDWIDNVYIPDVLAIAPYYLNYAGVGKGHGNFLSWGVFEDASFDPKKRLLPRGAIFAADFPKVHDAKPEDVAEHTSHSWYKGSKPLNPAAGETDPDYTGYDSNKKYTWAKAPRFQNKPMEVGALARMLVAYASGQPTAKKMIDDTLAKIGHAGQPQVLLGVIGQDCGPRSGMQDDRRLRCTSGVSTSSRT